MAKIIVENYTFDASEKKITFTDYNPIVLERILLITNVTVGVVIYQFNKPTKLGSVATNVLTLVYDTTTMNDTDDLCIIYDHAAYAQQTQIVDGSGNVIGATSGALRVDPQGNVAHDAVDAGNPIKIGGKVATSPRTAIANGDRVDAFFDNQGRFVTTPKCVEGTTTTVAASASSVTLLAANTGRLGASIYNDSTVVLYVKRGATASATSFSVKLQPDGYYEVPFGYTGVIDGIWASATGNARITEDI